MSQVLSSLQKPKAISIWAMGPETYVHVTTCAQHNKWPIVNRETKIASLKPGTKTFPYFREKCLSKIVSWTASCQSTLTVFLCYV